MDCKEIQPVHPKGDSLEGLMLKLKVQYFGHLMQGADSLEKMLMLGKIEGKRRKGWQRMTTKIYREKIVRFLSISFILASSGVG